MRKLGCVDISHLFPVIASAAGNLKSEIAACTTIFSNCVELGLDYQWVLGLMERWASQDARSLSIALSMISNFRIQATSATLALSEPLVEVSYHGVMPSCAHRRHIQRTPHLRSPSPSASPSPVCSTVPVERSHSHQRGYLLSFELAQLRQRSVKQETDPMPGTSLSSRAFSSQSGLSLMSFSISRSMSSIS